MTATTAPVKMKKIPPKTPPGPLEYLRRWPLQLWLVLVGLFLYIPLITLMIFSFNDSKRNIVWQGFTLKYYDKALHNDSLITAFGNSMTIALCSTIISVIIGAMAACSTPTASTSGGTPVTTPSAQQASGASTSFQPRPAARAPSWERFRRRRNCRPTENSASGVSEAPRRLSTWCSASGQPPSRHNHRSVFSGVRRPRVAARRLSCTQACQVTKLRSTA